MINIIFVYLVLTFLGWWIFYQNNFYTEHIFINSPVTISQFMLVSNMIQFHFVSLTLIMFMFLFEYIKV